MNNVITSHVLVRVWPDSSTTYAADLRLAHIYDKSIVLSQDRCDAYYSKWAASDYTGSFFDFVHCYETNGRCHKRVELTPEDRAIFARLWIHGKTPPITMIEGDIHDTEIMALLGECAAANDGHTTDKDLEYIEEATYIYWAEQCDPDFDFDPIIIS